MLPRSLPCRFDPVSDGHHHQMHLRHLWSLRKWNMRSMYLCSWTINSNNTLLCPSPPRWIITLYRLLWEYLTSISLERFSFQFPKTKTKVITLTNHNSHKQSYKPIRARSKYMSPVPSAGKRVRVSHDWFWFYFWFVEEVARDFLTNNKA